MSYEIEAFETLGKTVANHEEKSHRPRWDNNVEVGSHVNLPFFVFVFENFHWKI